MEDIMKVYVTFGQIHVHSVNGKTFDKDSIASIKCENYADGRRLAFEYFGPQFFTTYRAVDDEMLSFYPRGIIEV